MTDADAGRTEADADGPRADADAGRSEDASSSGARGADGTATGGTRSLDEVFDRPSASAGVVAASLALVGAFLPWTDAPPLVASVAGASSTPAAVLAGLALATFLVRRHVDFDRRASAAIAGLSSAGVVLSALARFVGPEVRGGAPPSVGVGLPIAAAAGILLFGFAVADYHEIPASGLVERARRPAVGFGLLIVVFVIGSLVGAPLRSREFGLITGRVLRTVVFDAVLVGVTLTFLAVTGRGIDFLDVRRPDVRDLVYVGVGFVALLAGQFLIILLITVFGLPSTSNQIVEGAPERPELLLALIPLQFLAVAPAEELFNRNLLQKYFYGAFSRPAAIVVASGIFASAHLFSYSGDTAAGTLVSVLAVLVLGVVLGVVYERTENIVVPIAAHGLYNAMLFALLYVGIVFGNVDQESLAALPW